MATVLPNARNFEPDNKEGRDQALQQLSTWITAELSQAFEQCRSLERPRIATSLIAKVESLVFEELDAAGYSFGRISYGGDINFEDSYQIFSNGKHMGTGIILEFNGFNCKASWRDETDDV